MDIEEIKTFLESNKDDEKVNKFVRSLTDQAVSRGCATFEKNFMENKLPGIIKEKLTGDPIVKKEVELTLKGKALDWCAEHPNVPYKLAIKVLTDPDTADQSLSELEEFTKEIEIKKAEQIHMRSAHKPQDSNYTPVYTIEALARIPQAERNRLREAGAFDALLGRR